MLDGTLMNTDQAGTDHHKSSPVDLRVAGAGEAGSGSNVLK
jgi:hypothetical protein